jgi:NADPH:quinone reductase
MEPLSNCWRAMKVVVGSPAALAGYPEILSVGECVSGAAVHGGGVCVNAVENSIARRGMLWMIPCMKAFGIRECVAVERGDCFVEFSTPMPDPGPQDVLVRVKAVGVNPVDTKVRKMTSGPLDPPRILGWDASGEIIAVGSAVTGFRRGDAVYYAGDITRPGCNAPFQCVDSRLIARKPQRLSFEEAAAMPLTTLTAWEGFERMHLAEGKCLLILGAAGGVGSIAIQLAKQTGCFVIATASRAETRQWCLDLGADAVIDHRGDILSQCRERGFAQVDAIANFVDTDGYWDLMGELIAPFGELFLIVEPKTPLRVGDPLKAKCVSLHWEFMFARAKFQTPDMAHQGEILQQAAELFDAGVLRHTMTTHLGSLSVASLREAHALLESGRAVGKIVMSVNHEGHED